MIGPVESLTPNAATDDPSLPAARLDAADQQVERFEAADGRRIYRLPLEVFPGFFGNAYLVLGGAAPILVDTGSGQAASNRGLVEGFSTIAERWNERVGFGDLGHVILTHGHIDHFGGISRVRRESDAPIAIHALDRRVVDGYRERVAVASRHVELFFRGAGVEDDRRARYMDLYHRTKALFRGGAIDEVFEAGPLLDGELEAVHVPGHCPGQVCLRIDDLMLTADHLLERITPHISPESITAHTGLSHYFDSLDRIEQVDGVRFGLGGHQGAHDIRARVQAIRAEHGERLERVLDLCAEPRSIVELSRQLFGTVRSYHVLLAVLETGAFVEYLHQRGELVAANVEALETEAEPIILYRRA